MKTMSRTAALLLAATTLIASAGAPSAALGQPLQQGVPEIAPPPPDTLGNLRTMARAFEPMVETDTAKAFLRAVDNLAPKPRRFVYYRQGFQSVVTPDEYARLGPGQKRGYQLGPVTALEYYEGLSRRDFPLFTARQLDLALKGTPLAERDGLAGARVLDLQFRTPTVGVLLASYGAEVVGVEEQTLAKSMYSATSDQGDVEGVDGAPSGSVKLVFGQWPADQDVKAEVGDSFDLILIDSSMAKGEYFPPPARGYNTIMVPAIELGVEPDEYVRSLYDALAPGGRLLFVARTIPQTRVRLGYRRDLDGRFPFELEDVERAGFEVIAWAQDDSPMLRRFVQRSIDAGVDPGAPQLVPLYSSYTLLQRPETDAR